MRLPRFAEPARVAFVGRQSRYGRAVLAGPAGGVQPRAFDVAPGDPRAAAELANALAEWAPHVVVALGAAPDDALAAVDAVRLAVADDVESAVAAADHVLCTDPDVAAHVEATAPVWRVAPLPVDDRLYLEPRSPNGVPPRALFLGSSTDHRERFLIGAKHEYDLLHYAHGLHGERLRDVLASTDVGVEVHGEPFDGNESTALLHLAAGHLLVAQPLPAVLGLEAGGDHIEVQRPDELLTVLYQLARRPETYDRIRLRGRAAAEAHRASRVWPRVIGDLLAELR